MSIPRILFSFLVFLLAADSSLGQSKVEQIDTLLKAYHDHGQLNGAVLVADNGKVIYKNGFGKANREWNIPSRPDTKFRIGSVTKQFTAALIMQLVAEGKMKLDGKITDYLTDYRKDTGGRITIHQLLNHTSGIPIYTGNPEFGRERRISSAVAPFVKKFASGDLEFEPGTKFNYNNSGYFILGAIIEQVAGQPYAKVVQERIFEPLGMKDTGYDVTANVIPQRAQGYERNPEGFLNADYIDMSLPYAAGSLYSTVEDLYKWDQALYEYKIVSGDGQKLMYTPGLSNFGYGFAIEERVLGKTGQKTKIIYHSGGIPGFNSLFTRAVDKRQLVVILTNVDERRYQERITKSILNILNGHSPELPQRSIADTLFKLSMEKGGAAAVTEYRRLRSAKPAEYDFAEGELNSLGYYLLRRDRTKDAIEIFKLNVEMYPGAFDPYDSLGEAYLADGQKELALANYKKSVQLNPENAGGVRAIRRIEETL